MGSRGVRGGGPRRPPQRPRPASRRAGRRGVRVSGSSPRVWFERWSRRGRDRRRSRRRARCRRISLRDPRRRRSRRAGARWRAYSRGRRNDWKNEWSRWNPTRRDPPSRSSRRRRRRKWGRGRLNGDPSSICSAARRSGEGSGGDSRGRGMIILRRRTARRFGDRRASRAAPSAFPLGRVDLLHLLLRTPELDRLHRLVGVVLD